LGVLIGDRSGCASASSSQDAEDGGRVVQSKEVLFSLLWAWKGSFEKGLAKLDRVMASFWAEMVRFGLKLGLDRVPNGPFGSTNAQLEV
jgi:hypothetical protein